MWGALLSPLVGAAMSSMFGGDDGGPSEKDKRSADIVRRMQSSAQQEVPQEQTQMPVDQGGMPGPGGESPSQVQQTLSQILAKLGRQ